MISYPCPCLDLGLQAFHHAPLVCVPEAKRWRVSAGESQSDSGAGGAQPALVEVSCPYWGGIQVASELAEDVVAWWDSHLSLNKTQDLMVCSVPGPGVEAR
jgi:hypothetical protein